jgi:hypothetical protein
VMLIAMLMSMVGTSAFALVDDDASIINGGVSIGGVQRPSNDSAYDGTRNDEGDDESTTVAPTGKTSAARVASEKNKANYTGKQDDYAGLTDSELDLVRDPDNAAFLKYIRDYVNEHESLSDEMTRVVQSALTIFGEEAIYGPSKSSENNSDDEGSEKSESLENDVELKTMKEELISKMTELDSLKAAYEAAYAQLDALDSEDEDYQAKYDELSITAEEANGAYLACADEVSELETAFYAAGGSLDDEESNISPVSVQSVIPDAE